MFFFYFYVYSIQKQLLQSNRLFCLFCFTVSVDFLTQIPTTTTTTIASTASVWYNISRLFIVYFAGCFLCCCFVCSAYFLFCLRYVSSEFYQTFTLDVKVCYSLSWSSASNMFEVSKNVRCSSLGCRGNLYFLEFGCITQEWKWIHVFFSMIFSVCFFLFFSHSV